MHSRIFKAGALLGGLAVAIGAFGAHGLKDALQASGMEETFKTGVLYHFVHSIFVCAIAISPFHRYSTKRRLSMLAVGGIVCFSGSLYLLSTLGWSWLGPITPIGGLLFIGAWLWSAFTARD